VSSSSSAASDSAASLLAASFAALAAELPAAHARMCALYAGRAVEIHVGEERFVASFAEGQGSVRTLDPGEATSTAEVRVVTTARAILDVIGARRSLAEAVLADEVEVVGALPDLVAAHAALLAYVHGGVRCPSFPALLERFVRATRR
jgi:hypothetical protein